MIPVFFVVTGSLTVVNKLIDSDWSGGELYGTVTYFLAQLGFYALKIIYFIFGFKINWLSSEIIFNGNKSLKCSIDYDKL